ncbi:hypothetical protein OPIT5_22985 [Opitutaceae bacterium TAV5]|nr:hypothetical protein OPIT5_22985 [Opitutaceae bacterium TAV5]
MKYSNRTAKFFTGALAVLTLAFAAASTTRAEPVTQTVIGNLSATQTGNGYIKKADGADGGRAVGFTMGDTALVLDSITLRLRFNGNECEVDVSLWSKNENANRPGSLVASMTPYTTTLNSSDPVDVTFSMPSTVTLVANTTYYIVVRSAKDDFYWSYAASGTYSMGAGASFVNGLYSDSGNTTPDTWTKTSSVCPFLEVNASLPGNIPENSMTSLALGAGAVLLTGVIALRRKR